MGIGERIRSKMDEKGIKGAELGRRVGVSRQAVYKWLSGESRAPRPDVLLRLASELDTTPGFLVNGRTPRAVLPDKSGPQENEVLVDVLDRKPTGASERKLPVSWRILEELQITADQCLVHIVRGDAMSTTLEDNDQVLIDTTDTEVIDGKVYAIEMAGSVRIKRLKTRYDGALVVMSDNKAFEDEAIPRDIVKEQVKVWGKVRHRTGLGGF